MRSVITLDGKSISAESFAEALIEMLESSQQLETDCPANRLSLIPDCGHILCSKFFGLLKQLNPWGQFRFSCPCHILGCEEAVKTAWLWLEDNNFI